LQRSRSRDENEETPMSLRGRVGRHANTGAQCQNWADDQQTVIDLLNGASVANGGAEGKLGGRVVAGIASEALCQAILNFQKKYFPAQPSGFVDPSGPVLAKMEALTAPAAAPAPPGQWGEFKSGSVQRALREALLDDNKLNQSEVAEILRATLANGVIGESELADLKMVAARSKSIMDRSKKMLEYFAAQVRGSRFGGPPVKFSSDSQLFAANMVCDFLKMKGPTRWTNLDRDEIGIGMLLRIAKPSLLRQSDASLCGPTSLLFSILQDQQIQYARYAIDMYEKAHAHIGRIWVKPSPGIFRYVPRQIDPVDWLTMASLRDSENWFFDYDNAKKEFAGITLPGELADWFRKAGYSDVKADANLVRRQRGTDAMDEASRLFSSNYRVCLFISANMIDASDQTKSANLPDHWVVLQSPIDRTGGNVKFTIFTWGDGSYQVPKGGPLSVDDFLLNFYGYVAAKA
jgi:hypothetical protein